MTPEELNRTIEFIIQSQARLAAAQEQDREDRVTFEKWSKGLFAQMSVDRQRIIKLISLQSLRIDWFNEFMIDTRAWQRKFQIEARKAAQKAQKRKRGQ